MECDATEEALEENEYFFTCKASLLFVREFKYF